VNAVQSFTRPIPDNMVKPSKSGNLQGALKERFVYAVNNGTELGIESRNACM
jgi:hypothetical protein